MPRVGRIALLFLVAVLVSSTWAQVAIPRFGTRGDAPPALVEEFALALRAGVRAVGGLDVTEADLITPGIAGSRDPESAVFIAELEGVRFAVSGEIARVGPEGTPGPCRIGLTILDAREGRSTDLINRPLRPEGTAEIAREIAEIIVNFTRPEPALPRGSSGLSISSRPGEADIFVNRSSVGETSVGSSCLRRFGMRSNCARRVSCTRPGRWSFTTPVPGSSTPSSALSRVE